MSGLPGVEGWLISVEEETTGRFLASTTGEIRNRDTRPVPCKSKEFKDRVSRDFHGGREQGEVPRLNHGGDQEPWQTPRTLEITGV